ncbi:hypothetical protein TAMA11512_06650 [Selenomonas sp. TAMA-11512]|uniref:flagellar basal body L-ring protein FlgH n=1 Tax=Selenomonas sp. TAMA-11512 TaxID=3095337 RepID=UPI003087C3BC|nr:hypothetical protein TAMA11512_06650 [Selenomonas sp. TAMA-11512]
MKKTKKFASLVMAAVFSLSLCLPQADVAARSLWSDTSETGTSSVNLFADRKARQVGDTLTIVINESTTTTQSKKRSNSKSGSANLNAGIGIFDFFKAASISGSDKFSANGSANDTSRFQGNITVTVVDVEPNGNMVVEGTQSIWQNRDEHKITLTGVVRRDDVTYDNTVPSTKVANAAVRFDGKGPLNAKQRQGILTQIFNFLF